MEALDRKDIIRGLIIGGGVGLLIQPILANNVPAHYLAFITPLVRVIIFLVFLILAPAALFVAKQLSKWRAGIYQFAQFAAVGTLNSFIDLGVLNLETFFYGAGSISNLTFAGFKAISFLFGTTNSFIWNKYWTFNSTNKTNAKEVGGFYSVAIIGWILNVSAATFVKSLGGVDASRAWINLAAPIGGIFVSFAWNFLGYKYLVFKDKTKI